MGATHRPMAAGGALALASAFMFGATTPLVQASGRDLGPFATASLLYAGAALVTVWPSVWPSSGRPDPPPGRRDLGRLCVVAFLGAVVAPVALAWGLQRTNGVTASLLLNLEALFTVVLARLLWAEPIGPRVRAALAATTAGGAILVSAGGGLSRAGGWGALAVLCATLAWAADNTLGRPLSDRDPARVVLAKSLLGASASAALARLAGESLPRVGAALALVACGAAGYGLSLRLYLRAQRLVGAARTGSIFAAAPFAGALVAWAMGQRAAGVPTLLAGTLCAVGVILHVTEGHAHAHVHEPVEHTHAHDHREPHHHHGHDQVAGEHTHPHRHDAVKHSHEHGLDEHHRHRH